jgi:hypothetical protein
MKKIIAFSIWGNNYRYLGGALQNAELALHFYPNWICRFYIGQSTRKDFRFINHQVFDYMWKRKMIKISKEQGDEIKAKVRLFFLAQAKKANDMLINDETMTQQCKKYSLMMHYNNQLLTK